MGRHHVETIVGFAHHPMVFRRRHSLCHFEVDLTVHILVRQYQTLIPNLTWDRTSYKRYWCSLNHNTFLGVLKIPKFVNLDSSVQRIEREKCSLLFHLVSSFTKFWTFIWVIALMSGSFFVKFITCVYIILQLQWFYLCQYYDLSVAIIVDILASTNTNTLITANP